MALGIFFFFPWYVLALLWWMAGFGRVRESFSSGGGGWGYGGLIFAGGEPGLHTRRSTEWLYRIVGWAWIVNLVRYCSVAIRNAIARGVGRLTGSAP